MLMFEWILVLLLAAIILTNLAERLAVPYPSLLAIAGVGLAFLPFAPQIRIEPELALALFVAPALLDAAFDTSPRDLRRNAIPIASLAVIAVVLTTAAVAFLGWRFAGLPIAGSKRIPSPATPDLSQFLFFLKPYSVLFHEFLHDGVLAGIELIDGANENELSLIQKRETVRHLLGAVRNIVGHDHLRESELALHFTDEVGDRLRHQRINHGCWFIVKNRFGLSRDGARDRDRALHPGTEFGGHTISQIFDLDKPQVFHHFFFDVLIGPAVVAERKRNVVPYGE